MKENNQSRDPAIQWIRVLEFNKESGIDFAEADPYYCTSASLHDKEATSLKSQEGELGSKSFIDAKAAINKPAKLSPVQKSILDNPDSQYPLYQVDANKVPSPNEGEPTCKVPRAGHFYVPVACQQCENPPCVKVCPVKATWKDPDGIVVIDYNWCIGCRYCMAACPYGARHFNWSEPNLPAEEFNPKTHYLGNRPRPRGVVEKCTFCIQRTRQNPGQYPACVEICPVGARKFGNLLDPASEIRQIMDRKRVLILKNELNTKPKFFYFYGTAT
ncbi:4Fe-4S dicluster domain-containing protein [Bdellovibrionota bacterium FG-2]